MCVCMRECAFSFFKDELIRDVLLWTPTHGCDSIG